MHALYELRPNMDPKHATLVQSVQQAPSQGWVYACILGDRGASGTVMEGTFLVNSFPARILFDSGASYSFISHSFMRRLHLSPKVLNILLSVATPLCVFSLLELIYRDCVVSLNGVQLRVDLIVLLISEFDIILGMNWLSSYHVSIDCFAKIVCL